MSKYSEMMGSFVRTGNYPLEANYIFNSENELKEFYKDELNTTTMHNGLLRVVIEDNNGELSLWWVVTKLNKLEFEKLISFTDIDNLQVKIDKLLSELERETSNRLNSDKNLLNNIKDLSTELLEFRETLKNFKDDIKAVVGTDQDDIISELLKLPYTSLSEISNKLHEFLETSNEDDGIISTFPELLKFLQGFDPLDNLYKIINILRSNCILRDKLLQDELNATLSGVGLDSSGLYSPDVYTNYLKNATSVMNALRILDSYVKKALDNTGGGGGLITPEDSSIIITETEDDKVIRVNIKEDENVLKLNPEEGLYTDIKINKLENPSEENVLEEYELLSSDNTRLGQTIKIYKDKNLSDVEFVDLDEEGHQGLFIKFTYILENGNSKDVYVDISEVIIESEYGDGLQVSDHKISVKRDPDSESYLTITSNGIKVSGITNAITETINNISVATTKEIETLVDEIFND